MNTRSSEFEQAAGIAAVLAGLVGLLYAIAFVILRNAAASALCLMLTGLLSLPALIAVFSRLGEVDSTAAMLGMFLAAAGALGAAIHGAYDLANIINPPPAPQVAASADLPSQIDPRGFLTFGVAGLAILLAGVLMTGPAYAGGVLRGLSFLLGALLVLIYLARLIVLTPGNPLLLVPVVVSGFFANPLWYILIGIRLRRGWTVESRARVGA